LSVTLIRDELTDAVKDDVSVAKVNCVEEKDICSSFDVKGYPTLKLFQNGKVDAFSGTR
jgi:protein disulfide-isomerase A1